MKVPVFYFLIKGWRFDHSDQVILSAEKNMFVLEEQCYDEDNIFFIGSVILVDESVTSILLHNMNSDNKLLCVLT